MDRYPLVLIGTDRSPDAMAGVRIGARIAAASGAPVRVLAVADDEAGDDAGRTGALYEAEAIAKGLGVSDVSLELLPGEPQDVLLERANAEPGSLVVVGSEGLSKASSRLVASTSNRLAHHSRADVLFAKDPLPPTWNFVALSTDGSESSHHAVRRGLRLATALGARGRLITVAKTEEAGSEVLDSTWRVLDLDAVDVEIDREVLIETQPASAIVAAGWKYQVVAIGNRGMSGPERLLGSVANKVSHGLKTNLLLVNTTRG
jgi:nucleotide-binding universal stress UspA family protein